MQTDKSTVHFLNCDAKCSLSFLSQLLRTKMRTRSAIAMRRENLPNTLVKTVFEAATDQIQLGDVLHLRGDIIACSNQYGVKIYDLVTNTERILCTSQEWELVKISEDEIATLSYLGSVVTIFNWKTGQKIKQFNLGDHSLITYDYGHYQMISLGNDCIAVGLSNDTYGYIGVYNVRTEQLLKKYSSGFGVNCITLLPRNRIAQGCRANSTIIIFDRTYTEKIISLHHGSEQKHINTLCEFEGYMFSGGEATWIAMWDLNSYTIVRRFEQADWIRSITPLGNGMIVSTSDDTTLTIWDIYSGEKLNPIEYEHGSWTLNAALINETTFASVQYNGEVKVWKRK